MCYVFISVVIQDDIDLNNEEMKYIKEEEEVEYIKEEEVEYAEEPYFEVEIQGNKIYLICRLMLLRKSFVFFKLRS